MSGESDGSVALVARGRKRDRRSEILDAAREVFLEEGYASASMATIAARLGGSKGTLYNYFPSKEDLFAAYVADACARVHEEAFDYPANEIELIDVVLQRVGERLLSHICSPWAVQNLRILATEAKRAPELAARWYEAGPAMGHGGLAALLEHAEARGELTIGDSRTAAVQFLSLCRSDLHMRLLLNLAATPSPDQISRNVAGAVRMFLALYRGERPLKQV